MWARVPLNCGPNARPRLQPDLRTLRMRVTMIGPGQRGLRMRGRRGPTHHQNAHRVARGCNRRGSRLTCQAATQLAPLSEAREATMTTRFSRPSRTVRATVTTIVPLDQRNACTRSTWSCPWRSHRHRRGRRDPYRNRRGGAERPRRGPMEAPRAPCGGRPPLVPCSCAALATLVIASVGRVAGPPSARAILEPTPIPRRNGRGARTRDREPLRVHVPRGRTRGNRQPWRAPRRRAPPPTSHGGSPLGGGTCGSPWGGGNLWAGGKPWGGGNLCGGGRTWGGGKPRSGCMPWSGGGPWSGGNPWGGGNIWGGGNPRGCNPRSGSSSDERRPEMQQLPVGLPPRALVGPLFLSGAARPTSPLPPPSCAAVRANASAGVVNLRGTPFFALSSRGACCSRRAMKSRADLRKRTFSSSPVKPHEHTTPSTPQHAYASAHAATARTQAGAAATAAELRPFRSAGQTRLETSLQNAQRRCSGAAMVDVRPELARTDRPSHSWRSATCSRQMYSADVFGPNLVSQL